MRTIHQLHQQKAALFTALSVCALTPACAMDMGDGTEWDESEESVDSYDQEIINGDSSTSNSPYRRLRTVYIRTPTTPAGICSGTLLLPDVVLTARHCVTTNGQIQGTIATATNVRARVLAVAPGPSANDLCTGATRDVSCARGSSISQLGGTTSDGVMIKLENPIVQSGTALGLPVFTPLELTTDEATYIGSTRPLTGWGNNACTSGAGVLRTGSMTVDAVDVSVGWSDGSTYHNLIQMLPSPNQGVGGGDSGGPTWGSATIPSGVIGVHSGASCTAPATPGAAHDWSIYEHRSTVRNILTTMTSNITRNLSATSQVNFSPSSSGWQIVSGKLTQTTNLARNYALLSGLAWQRMVDVEYKVDIQGPDDDYSGIVFNYWTADNHLRCDASEQNDHLRLVARVSGSDQVLASAAWAGDWGTLVTVKARSKRATNGTYPITCTISGGGASTVSVTGNFDSFSAGEAGVYNDLNNGAAYSNFTATKI